MLGLQRARSESPIVQKPKFEVFRLKLVLFFVKKQDKLKPKHFELKQFFFQKVDCPFLFYFERVTQVRGNLFKKV